jgi:hypothetical protein
MGKRASAHFVLLCIVCLLPFVIGCYAVNMPGPGGVIPGALVNVTTIPGDLTDDEVYAAYPDSFIVVGMVEGTSMASNVLGLVSFGDGGYLKAITNAKAKAGADGLINCVADVKTTSFLMLYSQSTTVVRGLAIKRR